MCHPGNCAGPRNGTGHRRRRNHVPAPARPAAPSPGFPAPAAAAWATVTPRSAARPAGNLSGRSEEQAVPVRRIRRHASERRRPPRGSRLQPSSGFAAASRCWLPSGQRTPSGGQCRMRWPPGKARAAPRFTGAGHSRRGDRRSPLRAPQAAGPGRRSRPAADAVRTRPHPAGRHAAGKTRSRTPYKISSDIFEYRKLVDRG